MTTPSTTEQHTLKWLRWKHNVLFIAIKQKTFNNKRKYNNQKNKKRDRSEMSHLKQLFKVNSYQTLLEFSLNQRVDLPCGLYMLKQNAINAQKPPLKNPSCTTLLRYSQMNQRMT